MANNTFFCIEIEQSIAAGIYRWLTPVRVQYPQLAWVDPTLYHVTLFFCGKTVEAQEDELCTVGKRVATATPSFTVELGMLRSFPGVLWVAFLSAGQWAHSLNGALEAATRSLALPAEAHHYTPHLTVALGRDAPLATSCLSTWGDTTRFVQPVREVQLRKSFSLASGKLHHELLDSFVLGSS